MSTHQPWPDGITYHFQMVIARRGYFLMPEDSYKEWQRIDRFFDRKLAAAGLRAKPVRIKDFFINRSNLFYIITYATTAQKNPTAN